MVWAPVAALGGVGTQLMRSPSTLAVEQGKIHVSTALDGSIADKDEDVSSILASPTLPVNVLVIADPPLTVDTVCCRAVSGSSVMVWGW